MKWYYYVGTLALAFAGYCAVFPVSTEEPVGGAVTDIIVKEQAKPQVVEESTYAEIAPDGTVLRVIVADQAFIDSGSVGDSKNWVKTSQTGAFRKNHAGIGYKYDETLDAFIPPKSKDAVVFDEVKAVWVEPVVTKTRIATTTK